MTDGLAVLAAVFGVAIGLYVLRRWGWPAVAGLAGFVVAVLGVAWRRERPSQAPVVVGDGGAGERIRERAAVEKTEALEKAEAAARLAADIEAPGDLDLLELAKRRSEGKA